MTDAAAGRTNGNGDAGPRLRPLSRAAGARRRVPCGECALCCTYVAVPIEPPNSVENASEILWYLYHEQVSVHVAGGDWMVQFETRCRNLDGDRRCRIYEERPLSCREYDEADCDVNAAEESTAFYSPEEFLAHLERHHAHVHRWLRAQYVPLDERALRRAGSGGRTAFARRLTTLRSAGGA